LLGLVLAALFERTTLILAKFRLYDRGVKGDFF